MNTEQREMAGRPVQNELRRVTAKFKCHSVEESAHAKTAKLAPVTDGPGNEDFTRYTPSGSLEIQITHEAKAGGFFKPGEEYFVDFTKAQ